MHILGQEAVLVCVHLLEHGAGANGMLLGREDSVAICVDHFDLVGRGHVRFRGLTAGDALMGGFHFDGRYLAVLVPIHRIEHLLRPRGMLVGGDLAVLVRVHFYELRVGRS